MWVDVSSTNVLYLFLPIIEWCELYNQVLLLSWLHMKSYLGRGWTFCHHIGQEYYVESNSTFVMLVTACHKWNHHPSWRGQQVPVTPPGCSRNHTDQNWTCQWSDQDLHL